MKKYLLVFTLIFINLFVFSQESWTIINSTQRIAPTVEIIEQSSLGLTIKLVNNAYYLHQVETPRGKQNILLSPEFCNSNDKGFPDLAHYSKSIVIPNSGAPKLQVISSEFQLLSDVEIAPSKGAVSRIINPADVPYEYGELYDKDIFFPNAIASLSEPFIIRDCRGISIDYYPFVYNAYTRELKIYSEIIVKIEFTNHRGVNELLSVNKTASEFNTVYEDMFINYNSGLRYTPLAEGNPGKILVICADEFAPAMKNYVNWKREKGLETELVLMSSIGTTSEQLKTYIKEYYTNKAMTYVLLVGDHEGVPTTIVPNGGGGNNYSGSQGHNDLDSDNKYAYIVGNDNYADVFIGRFSGSNLAHIKTQVDRTIHYEKSLITEDTWLGTCINSGSNQGNPKDEVLLNNIGAFLEEYGYVVTKVHQNGGSSSQMLDALNTGAGVVNYAGHGKVNTWRNFPFTNDTVKSLSNANRLPFIWSVACLNGQFRGSECFAEVWLQSTKNNDNIGGIAILASTILQDWVPPTHGQKEMNKLLVNSHQNNIKRTIGGISFNGLFKMIELNNNYSGKETADTWTLFGDPSLMVRTKTPAPMNITHKQTILSSENTLVVNSDVDGALVSVSKVENDEVKILAYDYSNGGTAILHLAEIADANQLTLTVTAFDKVTYQKTLTVEVEEPSEFNLSLSPKSLTFSEEGGVQEVQVTSNINWTATSNQEWLTISLPAGNGNESINITASPYDGDNERKAVVNFIGENNALSRTIFVLQKLTEPPVEEDPVLFYYDFENCVDLVVDNFYPCTTYDGDGINTYGIQEADYPQEGYTGAFMAFRPSYTNPPLHNKATYAPRQGEKYGACFSAKPVNGVKSTNNDWFITPRILLKEGSKFRFWAKSTKVNFALERFNVLVSTSTNAITDFTKISEGDYVEAPLEWRLYEYDLSAYKTQSVYIAIQCVSHDSFIFQIDELEVIAGTAPSVGYTLAVSPDNLIFDGSGGDITVEINSNVNWEVSSNATWLKIGPTSGQNVGSFVISADANKLDVERNAIVKVLGDNGLAPVFITVLQSETSSVLESNKAPLLSVYPNPSSDYIEISSNCDIKDLQIINMLGKVVLSENCKTNKIKISVSNLKTAQYILRVLTDNGDLIYNKIIVR